MPVGQPLKFKTPGDLRKKVEAYFTAMTEEKRPFLIIGLAHYLGTNRTTLMEYEGKIEGREKGTDPKKQLEYANIIKNAKERCALWLQENTLVGGAEKAMAIFSLKANHKWRDGDREQLVNNITINKLSVKEEAAMQKVLDNEYSEDEQ